MPYDGHANNINTYLQHDVYVKRVETSRRRTMAPATLEQKGKI